MFMTTPGYLARQVRTGKQKMIHREVMEMKLGRRLRSDEIVHHRDGDKLNNDPSNLEITTRSAHARYHHLKPGNRVRLLPSGRWFAFRNLNGKQITVGTFETEEEAREAA